MSLLSTIELGADQHLYGRSKEIKLLLEAYSRCKHENGDGAPECVLITGASGMGKTSLVQSKLRPTVTSDHGIFLSGKFELSPHHQPYEVIVSIFTQLADHLLGGDERLQVIQKALSDTLGGDVWILTDVIPGLESVIGEQEGKSNENFARTESLSQFQFVFCEFCRVVSSILPMVIFLDDMQWCDQASMELIQALLRPRLSSSESNPKSSLLIVAASRDELEANNRSNGEEKSTDEGTYVASAFLNDTKTLGNISRIHLSCLSETETRDLLVHNFELGKEAAQALAARAYSTCSGNILQTLQYMRSIRLENDFLYRINEAKANVDEEPHEQESIEKLILNRIHTLPMDAQSLLQIAACMGNMINETALCKVKESPPSEITQLLAMAVKEELLELVPKRSSYRFVHDSVRQAVLTMVRDKVEMSFQIGHKLWQQSSPPYTDSDLFTMVNLLNKGITLQNDSEERYKMAELNLNAGRRAAAKVSFRDASRYYNAGIEFLKTGDFWTDQYEFALQLYSAAAAAELANHNFASVDVLVEEIFQHARCFLDTIDARATQIVNIGHQGKVLEATNIGLDVLRQLGEKVPKQTEIADIQTHVVETERALRGRSNADILSLPFMEDEATLARMRFLVMMIPYALEAGSPYANWIATRVVRLTMSHGLSKGCAHGFASYARFTCSTSARLGYNYGQLAVHIVDKCGAKGPLPRVYVSIYSFTSIWTRPLRESLNPLQVAFEIAVENGDVEYALMASFFRSLFTLYVGTNLVQVEQILNETRRQLIFYNQNLLLNLTNPALQFVLNLTGKASNPKILTGEACDLTEADVSDKPAVSYVFHGFSSKIAYLFEDFDLADRYAQVLFASRVPFTSYWVALHQFQMGLIAIAQVRRDIEPEKNLERAQLCIKKMAGWTRDCPDNFLNKKALLDAEIESLKTPASVDPKVVLLYNQAIEGALEEGFLDEAAIACERAGDYMHRNNNIGEAERLWNQAERIFRRWGATTKADTLKKRAAKTLAMP